MYRLLLWCLLLPYCLSANNEVAKGSIDKLLKQSLDFQRVNVDSCHLLAKQALFLSEKINYKKGIAGAYNQLCAAMMIRGNQDSALFFCTQSLLVSLSIKDSQRSVHSYVLMSYIYQKKGNQDSAMKTIFEAMRISQVTNDSVGLTKVYSAMGNFYLDYGDYPQALTFYKRSYLLSLSINNYSYASDALLGIANVYYLTKSYKMALGYYLQLDSINRRINEPTSLVQNQNNIALCYADLGDKQQALRYYGLALKGYKQYGLRFEEANGYYNLGELYHQFKQPDSAIYYANKAVILARDLNDIDKIAKCNLLLAQAYSAKGNYTQAYAYQKQYAVLNDSLLNREKVRSIAEMQTKYETEKKEQQIALLDQQTQTRKAQRNFFIAGSVVLFLALLSLGIYYQQKQRLAKTKEKIAKHEIDTLLKTQELKTFNAMVKGQEEERQRIATDLHDRLGSMLATVKLLFSGLETTIDSSQQDNNKQYHTATNLLDEACVEVRRISHNMSTGMVMSFGVIAALKELSESIESSGLITCKVLHYGMDERLDQQTEIGIYRMIQEIIGNVLKHAKATEVIIQLNKIEELLSVTVEDNGIGFDVEAKRKSRGMGLKNLENRATKLGGSLHIESEPAKGTIFIIEIPLTLNT